MKPLRLSFLILVFLMIAGTTGWAINQHGNLAQASWSYWKQDWKNARDFSSSYLRLHPENPWGLLIMARSLVKTGDWQPALRVYQQLDSKTQMPMYDRRLLAEFYRNTRQHDKQMEQYELIRENAPQDVDNLVNMGLLYQENFANYHLASQLFEQAAQLNPANVKPWVGLFYAYLELSDHKRAADYLRKAIELQPPDVWKLHSLLGEVLLDSLGDTQAALASLMQAIELRPDEAKPYSIIARCYQEQNPPELKQARRYLERALDINPNYREALKFLSALELYEGNSEQALSHIVTFLSRNPDDIDFLQLQRIATSDTNVQQLSRQRELKVTWQFTDVASKWNVSFKHNACINMEKRYFPETLGSGVAVFDYDGDGFEDLYFVNFNFVGPEDKRRDSKSIQNVLYRNLGNGTFEDCSSASGLSDHSPGHGVSIGDYDNDGDPDLYLTNFGPNRLFRNDGDGHFSDITTEAGISDSDGSMSTSAAWFDYDQDGDLDIYVCNYSDYDLHDPVNCYQPDIGHVYCGPDSLPNQRHTLFENGGDGTFRDITRTMGIDRRDKEMGKGLGIVAAHLNSDDNIDLFVANDSTPNFLFWGDGNRLIDGTEQSGADVNNNLEDESCMGVDAADLDGDGRPELIVTNQWGQKNTVYRNMEGLFIDATDLLGLTAATKRAVGWGTGFLDFDSDGDLDNFVTNGHFYDWRDNEPLFQKATLWQYAADGVFTNVSAHAGDYFDREVVGRGAGFGDIDNDGDLDIVLNHWNQSCAILRNDTQTEGSWIRLQLVGTTSNRDAVGTRLEFQIGTRLIYRQITAGTSYLSDHDPRLLVGIGEAEKIELLRVRWPDGQTQEFQELNARQSYRIIQGLRPETIAIPVFTDPHSPSTSENPQKSASPT